MKGEKSLQDQKTSQTQCQHWQRLCRSRLKTSYKNNMQYLPSHISCCLYSSKHWKKQTTERRKNNKNNHPTKNTSHGASKPCFSATKKDLILILISSPQARSDSSTNFCPFWYDSSNSARPMTTETLKPLVLKVTNTHCTISFMPCHKDTQ